MDAVKYKNPSAAVYYSFDFGGDLGASDNIKANGAFSKTNITAVDSSGKDVTADIISKMTVSTDTLRADFKAGTDGEDYTVTYTAESDTTANPSEIYTKVLELRVRSNIA